MSKHLSMGAVDTETGNHIYPAVGQKGRNYKCPECEKPVIFKHGTIKAKHFAHKANSNCTFYENPGETIIHREAKKQIAALLNNRGDLTFERKCLTCPQMKEYKLSELYTETSQGKEEHRFDYNNSKCSADVALVDNDNILLIVEILHTHKTDEEKRPEPWVEVNAKDVINQINETGSITHINCMRQRTICESCVKKALEREQKALEREQKEKEIKEEYQKIQRKIQKEREADDLEKINKSKLAYIAHQKLIKLRQVEREAENLDRKLKYEAERANEQNCFFEALAEIRKKEEEDLMAHN